MTAWISIEHAPKDRPVDLWLSDGKTGHRIADGKWAEYVNAALHGDTKRHLGWCNYHHVWDEWTEVEFDQWRVTHYMEIPEGPK